jgi:asparagine synthase (glutamine-hydrolysing)
LEPQQTDATEYSTRNGMSGICGWFGFLAGEFTQLELIRLMAAPLILHPTENVRSAVSQSGAVAAASRGNSADVYQDDHVLVAIEGHVDWSDPGLSLLAQHQGTAKTLADSYQQKGLDVLKSLTGTFALALVHHRKKEILLAVDRMGGRPLSYAVVNGCLVFGSTADSVRIHPSVTATIDPQAIFEYLYFETIPSPRTIYAEVKKFQPAQYLRCQDGELRIGRYWHPQFRAATNAPFHALKAELRNILTKAVQRCDPHCEAGAFLSGGIDSSTICGILSQRCQAQVKSYSIGFEAEGYDEIEYVRIAADHFNVASHEYYVRPEDVVATAALVARTYDEPFGNSSAVPLYHCARQAKENGTDIMLAGDGGDELFAGNTRYVKQKGFEFYSRIPRTFRTRVLQPLIFASSTEGKTTLLSKARSYIRQANIPLPQRLQTHNPLELIPATEMFEAPFLEAVDHQSTMTMYNDVYSESCCDSALDRMLYLDWKYTLADNDLRKVSRMCEVWGIDVRYPMLDSELVEFATQIPADLKVKGFTLRYFFKEAFKDFLPRDILTKPKHGFGLPFGVWLTSSNPLKELVLDNMHTLKRRGYIRPRYIDELIKQHQTIDAAHYGKMVWLFLMLEVWLTEHGW